MVGYNPEDKSQLTKSDYALAGAISSAVSRAVAQPLDVLKIRFQLQIEPISRKGNVSKYQSLYQAVTCIVKEEGTRALWKGHIPAQVLSVGYGIVQFTVLEYLTKVAWNVLPDDYRATLRPVTHTVCGSMAACVAAVAIQPLDILRTRFVAQGQKRVYNSLLHASASIMRTEGIRGFYRGLIPAMVGVAPQMGLQFGLYAALQNSWNTMFMLPDQHHPGVVESFICGSGSGFLSKLIAYPMDIVKKRLQIQGFEEARKPFGAFRKYNGLIDCVIVVVKEEGLTAIYKGLCPSLLKAVVVSGTIFCVYDQILGLMLLRSR